MSAREITQSFGERRSTTPDALGFGLTALSALFVAIDIRNTPENPVMKWAFVLFTLYSGPFGTFLYVLGCREPLPGLHEQYVSARGGRCSARPCTASTATASASSSAR